MTMVSAQPSILVADRDARRKGALETLCRLKGWGCQMVSDAQEFQQRIEAERFDLVIADVEMPGLGYQALLGNACSRRPSQLLVVIGDPAGGPADVRMVRGNETDLIAQTVDLDWVERCMDQATVSRRQETREQLAYSFVVSERTEMRFSCRQLGEAQAITLPIVARLVASRRLSDSDSLKMRLAVQEAVLNAVEHGNLELESRWKEERIGDTDRFSIVRKERLSDPTFANRLVAVTSWFDGEIIEIAVRDQGKGFVPTQLPDIGKNNLSCFGRGLTLMNNAVDEVRFSCGGSEVTLVKRLTPLRST